MQLCHEPPPVATSPCTSRIGVKGSHTRPQRAKKHSWSKLRSRWHFVHSDCSQEGLPTQPRAIMTTTTRPRRRSVGKKENQARFALGVLMAVGTCLVLSCGNQVRRDVSQQASGEERYGYDGEEEMETRGGGRSMVWGWLKPNNEISHGAVFGSNQALNGDYNKPGGVWERRSREKGCNEDPTDPQVKAVKGLLRRQVPEHANKIAFSRRIKCQRSRGCFKVSWYQYLQQLWVESSHSPNQSLRTCKQGKFMLRSTVLWLWIRFLAWDNFWGAMHFGSVQKVLRGVLLTKIVSYNSQSPWLTSWTEVDLIFLVLRLTPRTVCLSGFCWRWITMYTR